VGINPSFFDISANTSSFTVATFYFPTNVFGKKQTTPQQADGGIKPNVSKTV